MNMVDMPFFSSLPLYSSLCCVPLPYINNNPSEAQCDLINAMFLLVISALYDGRSTDERNFHGT